MAYNVTVLRKEYIADQTVAVYLSRPRSYHYQAGQYADIAIEGVAVENGQSMVRIFSFVSSPHEEELIVAMRVRDSMFKRTLLRSEGEPITVSVDDALGTMVLPDNQSRPIVMMAGGVGIVPFVSMLRYISYKKLKHPITLLYSDRSPQCAPYLEELHQHAYNNEDLTFIPSMTRIKPEDDWRGRCGRIDKAHIEQVIFPLQDPIYFIAGSPSMVREMRQTVSSLGVGYEDIIFEEFSGY